MLARVIKQVDFYPFLLKAVLGKDWVFVQSEKLKDVPISKSRRIRQTHKITDGSLQSIKGIFIRLRRACPPPEGLTQLQQILDFSFDKQINLLLQIYRR
jgi:hypothetical protein